MKVRFERGCGIALGYEREALEEARTAVALDQPVDLDGLVEALGNAIEFGLSAYSRQRQARRALRRAQWEAARAKLTCYVLFSVDGPTTVYSLIETMPDDGEAVPLFTTEKKALAYRDSDSDPDMARYRAILLDGDYLREFLRDRMANGISHIACDPVEGHRPRYERILHFLAEAEGK
jgi:hypothetical protein